MVASTVVPRGGPHVRWLSKAPSRRVGPLGPPAKGTTGVGSGGRFAEAILFRSGARLITAFIALGSAVAAAAAQSAEPAIVARIGDYVERYYGRAQSILALETVAIQPLRLDLTSDGFARRLVYELRVEWNPDEGDGQATVVRELLSVNGRPPRKNDEPRCTDPRGVSPEPLATLLPARRGSYAFTQAGLGTVDGRTAVMVDYRALRPEPPKVEWRDECASIDLPGRTRGRIWADPETAEILRFDEHLVGLVDIPVPIAQQRKGGSPFMTVERADMSIQYRRTAFVDPDETLMLPAQIDSVVVVRNSGSPRLRITQTFSGYRRFVTASRILR